MAITADFQIEVNGILMRSDEGATVADYVNVSFPNLFGKRYKPSTDIDLPGDGVHFGTPWLAAESLAWTIEIVDADATSMQSRIDAVLAAWDGIPTVIEWRQAGQVYSRVGVPRQIVVDDTSRPLRQMVSIVLEFVAQPTITEVP